MAGLYKIARPLLFALAPETSHRVTLALLRCGFSHLVPTLPDPDVLSISLWGLEFSNPIGIAAGFDKNAEVPTALLRLGFGFTEAGTITPLGQAGNPPPRLFRLAGDQAVINRLGFNNRGLEAAAKRFENLPSTRTGPVGANIGANRDSPEPLADYSAAIEKLADLADYFVINVSSPNTPGLRDLQSEANLSELLRSAKASLRASRTRTVLPPPPILVKVAPDLDEVQKQEIARAVLAEGADGLIISNTTLSRPRGLKSKHQNETGGLSGAPLLALSTDVLGDFYRLTGGTIPLVGVGGIASGEDAYKKIRAGASLVQLYTALIYQGPGLIKRIKSELSALLVADGFGSVSEAVGADHRDE